MLTKWHCGFGGGTRPGFTEGCKTKKVCYKFFYKKTLKKTFAVMAWNVIRHCEKTFDSIRCIELKRTKNVFVAISCNVNVIANKHARYEMFWIEKYSACLWSNLPGKVQYWKKVFRISILSDCHRVSRRLLRASQWRLCSASQWWPEMWYVIARKHSIP